MGGDGHTVPAGASEVRLCKAEMLTERLGGQEAGAATGGNGRRHQGLRSQTQPAASALQAAELQKGREGPVTGPRTSQAATPQAPGLRRRSPALKDRELKENDLGPLSPHTCLPVNDSEVLKVGVFSLANVDSHLLAMFSYGFSFEQVPGEREKGGRSLFFSSCKGTNLRGTPTQDQIQT